MGADEAQEIRTLLLQTDDQYRQLAEEHHQLDAELHRLTEHRHPTESDHLQEVTLKKRKLAIKDRMEEIARGFQQAQPTRAS